MKEIKLISKIEDGCIVDEDLGAYVIVENGMDDIVIINNYKYRELSLTGVNALNNKSEYRVVEVENHQNYVVKPLDTLASIASQHNTTEDELKALNDLSNNKVFIGQILKI